jgi:hypothetical protein
MANNAKMEGRPAGASEGARRATGEAPAGRPPDPRTGDSKAAGNFPARGIQAFSTPDGWEDALLVLE